MNLTCDFEVSPKNGVVFCPVFNLGRFLWKFRRFSPNTKEHLEDWATLRL